MQIEHEIKEPPSEFTESEIDQYLAARNWTLIPSHMRPGVELWLKHGLPPGSFLFSILRHDFYTAAHHADIENQDAFFAWAKFLYNEMPHGSHGPREAGLWANKGGFLGTKR